MTFEEFFKKKKISLPLLQGAEPALHAEFEHHFAQMGEKSFDHTKKYWFNQLRRRYPLPAEVKAEKLVLPNPLAEQTITEALSEPAAPAPTVGFKPKFRATPAAQPAGEKPATEDKPADTAAPPAIGFKPRFKATMAAKPAEEKAEEKVTETPAADTSSIEEAPKPAAVGFKPRFKASMAAKPAEDKPAEKLTADTLATEEAPKPAVGFKPRFKASMVTKPAEDKSAEEPAPDTPTTEEAPKPAVGFKPRFKASMVAKPAEEQAPPAIEQVAETKMPEQSPTEPAPEAPAEAPQKPVGFKPRFNAAKMKPKDPGTE